MSMTPPSGPGPTGPEPLPPEPSEIEAMAMEYVLGGMSRFERKAAEVRLARDPAFRAAVEQWQAVLSPLDEATAPVAPPPGVWASIEAEVQPAPRLAMAAKAAAPVPGWWQNLAFWRAVGIGGPVVAAIAVAMLVMPAARRDAIPAAVSSRPALVATLADADGRPLLAAAYDPAIGAVRFAPAAPDAAGQGGADQARKVPQLWVIEGTGAPRSLGVIDIAAGSSHSIPRDRLAGLKAGAVLAVSIEPLGGSPTGAPTGPIIATGTLSAA